MNYKTKTIEINAICLENKDSSIFNVINFIYGITLTSSEYSLLTKLLLMNKGIYINGNTKVNFGDFIIKDNDTFLVMNPVLFQYVFNKI